MLYYYEIVREVTVIRTNAMLNSVVKYYWDILQLNWNICSKVKFRPELSLHDELQCCIHLNPHMWPHIIVVHKLLYPRSSLDIYPQKTSSFWPLTPNIRIEHIILFSLCIAISYFQKANICKLFQVCLLLIKQQPLRRCHNLISGK